MIAKGLHKIIHVKYYQGSKELKQFKQFLQLSGISSQKAAQELTNIIYKNLDFVIEKIPMKILIDIVPNFIKFSRSINKELIIKNIKVFVMAPILIKTLK